VADSNDRDHGWQELQDQKRTISPALIVAAVLAILLVVFILQNSDDTNVTWVVTDSSTPLWVVIFVSAIAGYLVGQLIEVGVRRHRRSRRD
jgi:uncharacterized integral membrane protein